MNTFNNLLTYLLIKNRYSLDNPSNDLLLIHIHNIILLIINNKLLTIN